MKINVMPDDVLPPSPPKEDYPYYRSSKAPLKSNAREAVKPFWRKLGFATTPVKRQQSNLVVRVVWLYPAHRTRSPYEYYESALRVSIPHSMNDDDWGMYIPCTATYRNVFMQFFDSTRVKHPRDIFSETGLEDIRIAQEVSAGGLHPRTRLRLERIEFVRANMPLWNQLNTLVNLMREHNLLSKNPPVSQQLYDVRRIVEKIKEGSL